MLLRLHNSICRSIDCAHELSKPSQIGFYIMYLLRVDMWMKEFQVTPDRQTCRLQTDRQINKPGRQTDLLIAHINKYKHRCSL